MRAETINSILLDLGGERRIHYSLERLRVALRQVGNPHLSVKPLVIAGTNGKGSTSLLISSALVQAEHKVCTYLSPHLWDVSERFLCNMLPIPDEKLNQLANRYGTIARKNRLSYFEFLTLLFFVWSAELKADFMVLEVGLGGRLDATNVVDPIASVITSIGMDHQKYLGNTPEAILSEKLGIIRPEGLVFCGIEQPELLDITIKKCLELDAIYYFSNQLRITQKYRSWDGQQITLHNHSFQLRDPSPAMAKNAALAYLVMKILFPVVPIATLQKAFSQVKCPARFEVFGNHPRVLLSCAHNFPGISGLNDTLDHLGSGPVHTVAAFSPDKEHHKLIQLLKKRSNGLILTKNPGHQSNALPSYSDLGVWEADYDRAVDRALSDCPKEGTVLITGSTYLVGALRRRWSEKITFIE